MIAPGSMTAPRYVMPRRDVSLWSGLPPEVIHSVLWQPSLLGSRLRRSCLESRATPQLLRIRDIPEAGGDFLITHH